jgi:hypothetical protein
MKNRVYKQIFEGAKVTFFCESYAKKEEKVRKFSERRLNPRSFLLFFCPIG